MVSIEQWYSITLLLASLKEISRAHTQALNTRRYLPARRAASSSWCERHRHRRPTKRMRFLSIEPESRMSTHGRPPRRERPGLLLPPRSHETHRATKSPTSTLAVAVPESGFQLRPWAAATLLLRFLHARALLLSSLLPSICTCFHHAGPAWHAIRRAHSFWRREG